MKKVNQHGTLKKDTSETICIKNFDINLSKRFINWFIGFVEGQENTFIVNRRYLRFEINCLVKNQEIIYYIKRMLGFGEIRKLKFLDNVLIEFSVQDNIMDLLKLIKIFNGNLRSTIKNRYFQVFYKKLERKLKNSEFFNLLPSFDNSIKKIVFSNSWLLGYIDSRALFFGRWHKSKKLKNGKKIYLCCIFWDLNQEILLNLKNLFNTPCKIEEKQKWNLFFFKLVIDDINSKNQIVEYLQKFLLKTKNKKKKLKYWMILLNYEKIYINTGNENFEEVEKILKKISLNVDEDELNKI